MSQEYAMGWRRAALWANRDDLIADIESPAYERDMAADIATLRQPAARVDEGMVFRAMRAWGEAPPHSDTSRMRAALEAALSAQPAPVDPLDTAVGWLDMCGGSVNEIVDRLSAQPAPERQGACIGEVRENGVTWFRDNPHAFPVGTRFYTHPAAPVGVPAGWTFRWHTEGDDSLLLISHPRHGGVGVHKEPTDARTIPEEILYLLARDLLAAAPSAPQGTQQGEG